MCQALGADNATCPRDWRLEDFSTVTTNENEAVVFDGEFADAAPDLCWKVEERFWALLVSCVSDCSSFTFGVA